MDHCTPLYLADTYCYEGSARIAAIAADEKGPYCLLDRTIFYPQGGGQPCDVGLILLNDQSVPVDFVRMVEGEIRHYAQGLQGHWIHAPVELKVDRNRRLLNARLHTAGHLIANVVEDIQPLLKAVKSHSFPGEAYVECVGTALLEVPALKERLEHVIAADLSISILDMLPEEFEQRFYKLHSQPPTGKVFRVVRIGSFPPIPCGGTHIAQLSELVSITLRKVAVKGDKLKISYDVAPL